MNNSRHRAYEFGEFRFDAHARQLLKPGQIISLTCKVFAVLRVLVERTFSFGLAVDGNPLAIGLGAAKNETVKITSGKKT